MPRPLPLAAPQLCIVRRNAKPIMKAKLKCSACGAELDTVTLSWGKAQSFIALPLILFALFMFWMVGRTFVGNDFTKDLHLVNIQNSLTDSSLTVLGAIENSGSRRWDALTIKAEFFTSGGQFVGEQSRRLDSSIAPRSKENFSITVTDVPQRFVSDQGRIDVKISHAFKALF